MKKFALVLALFLGACANDVPQYAATPQNYQTQQQCYYYPARFGHFWVNCNGFWYYQ